MLISLTASTVAPTSVSSELSSETADSEAVAVWELMSLNCSAKPGPTGSSAANAKVENFDKLMLEAAESMRQV